MFTIIVVSIMKKRCAISSAKVRSSFVLYRENLIIAVSLAAVLGLGWGFGLLSTSYSVKEVTIAFQVLFSIFVGAQGVLLFLLHGVRNADARSIWKGLASGFCSTSRMYSSSRKSTKDSVFIKNLDRSTVLHTLPHVSDEVKVDLTCTTLNESSCGIAATDIPVAKEDTI